MKNLIVRITVIIVFGLLIPKTLFSGGYGELYRIKSTDIAEEVLKNTTGILTINSGADKKGLELRIYSKSKSDFSYKGILKAKNTLPISDWGSLPREDDDTLMKLVTNYKYPIINELYPFINIVYDPIKNLSAWVNLKEVEKDFYVSIVKFDSIEAQIHFL